MLKNIYIYRIILVIRAYRDRVGKMLAQCHRRWPNITSALGPMYSVIRVVAFLATGGEKRHPNINSSKLGTIAQCCFNVGPASKALGHH